jgi:hypothetical protein
MNNKKIILLLTSSILLASFGFWFYEKKRVQALNKQVDTIESAMNKLNNI